MAIIRLASDGNTFVVVKNSKDWFSAQYYNNGKASIHLGTITLPFHLVDKKIRFIVEIKK